MWGCFENAFVNDTSLDPRPLPSLHMRRRYSALSVVPILFINYRRFIKWQLIRQWNQFLDIFPSFSNAVGMIDGTIHRIRRLSGPLQAEFYCGDKCCHYISSQIVVDADGLIVLLFTGYSINRLLWKNFFLAWTTTTIVPYRFPGHMNDARCYWSLPQVGHGRARDLPVEHVLGNLRTGRFRGNCNFSDRKSLGRKQRHSRENINVKQQMKFAAATSVANSVHC